MTMHGKTRTTAKGIEMFFSRIRRRNSALGENLLALVDTSSKEEGIEGDCMFFVKYRKKPIRGFW
jgi:hypothetical protein